ncbi:hypothetical protein MMC24_007561 [Lignoscripta atroalba]|nr:hypothetical protein [Lignoscripta atroalba]
MVMGAARHSLVEKIRQSPPIDVSDVVDESWVKDKTIVITGGASGFGAGFLKRWAAAGAVVIIGDVNSQKGEQLIREVRTETGNQRLHFVQCDVTSWPSQVSLFKEAVQLSPHGGIDAVVANAGISDTKHDLESPKELDAPDPPPPNIDVLNVNLIGVVYTSHLALYYLPRNPDAAPADPKCDPTRTYRDRHLLLIGSLASVMSLPGQALYGASKHAVLGLYRCLRSTSFVHGVRVNLICPYFIDTPFLDASARAVLAGGTLGTIEDVVEAATRFSADPRVVGRALSVGPKLKVEQSEDGEWSIAGGSTGEKKAIWEMYTHDFEDCDVFQRKFIGILNRAAELRGWTGWASDMCGAVSYAMRSWWRTKN